MELREAILSRRSVKQFDPTHSISDEELRDLVRFGALAPTSFNMQNWQFVAVRDAERKAALCAASWNQVQVKEAALVLMICGNLKACEETARYLRDAPQPAAKSLDGMIRGFYCGNDELNLQEACRSAGLAGQNLMLMARELGYDSCPMIGFDPVKVSAILGLPEHCPPLLMLTIGRAAAPARPRMGLLDLEEVLSLESYDQRDLSGPIEG